MDQEPLLKRCKTLLKQHYGARFKGLVVYGSVAQGKADAESDLDLLVLLSGPVDTFQELHTIIDLLYPLQLESGRLISAKPVSWEEFKQGSRAFFREIQREGLAV